MVQTPTRQLFDQFKHMQEMPLQRKCRQWVTPPTPTYSWWWKTSLWLDILLKHGFINAINVNNSQHMLVLNSPKLGSFIRYVCLLWAPLSSHTYVVVESIIKYCHSTTFTNEKTIGEKVYIIVHILTEAYWLNVSYDSIVKSTKQCHYLIQDNWLQFSSWVRLVAIKLNSKRNTSSLNWWPRNEPWGNHTSLHFVTTCDTGVFNEGYLWSSQYFSPSYL